MALTSIQDADITPSKAPEQAVPGDARLSLAPEITRSTAISGGWWPRSRDAGAELPGLIAQLSRRVGRVRRVALQVDAFDNIPHQLAVNGHKVHVAWFRHMNPNTAILTMAGRDDLILLVIPPEADQAAAAEALRLAASGRRGQQPESVLAASVAACSGDDVSVPV